MKMYLFLLVKLFPCLFLVNFVFSLECDTNIDCNQVPGWSGVTRGECSEQNEKLSDPSDCRKYFLCYEANDPNPELKYCPQFMVFDSIIKDCIGWCQVTNITTTTSPITTTTESTTTTSPITTITESTTTTSPITTTTESTTTSPIITTTTSPITTTESTTTTSSAWTTTSTIPSTTTENPPEPPPSKCSTVGERYYNKLFCYKYYECQVVGKPPVLQDCPYDTHFDPQLEECIPEMCDYPKPPKICEDYSRFQDYLNCTCYYKCYQTGKPPTPVCCITGKWFDPNQEKCVNGVC